MHGPTGPAPSAVLTQGEAGTTVPLTVVLTPGDISLDVRSRFGDGSAHAFVVDTGSSQTVVANSLAKRAHLAPTDLAQRQTTVCSTITAPLVHSGTWSVPGVTLHPQLLGSVNFGPIGGRHGGPAGVGSAATLRVGDLRLQRRAVGPRVAVTVKGRRRSLHGDDGVRLFLRIEEGLAVDLDEQRVDGPVETEGGVISSVTGRPLL